MLERVLVTTLMDRTVLVKVIVKLDVVVMVAKEVTEVVVVENTVPVKICVSVKKLETTVGVIDGSVVQIFGVVPVSVVVVDAVSVFVVDAVSVVIVDAVSVLVAEAVSVSVVIVVAVVVAVGVVVSEVVVVASVCPLTPLSSRKDNPSSMTMQHDRIDPPPKFICHLGTASHGNRQFGHFVFSSTTDGRQSLWEHPQRTRLHIMSD